MSIPFQNLVVLDIETVSQYADYDSMPEHWQQLWAHKVLHQLGDGDTPETFYDRRAAILAEFGKIICISLGFFHTPPGGNMHFRIKSVWGDNEAEVLQRFLESMMHLQKHLGPVVLAGHNIREFDIPYLCRRMLIHQFPLPDFLDFQHKKPWEVQVIDSFSMWKFGDYKNYTSLDLLAACMQVPSPKANMDGSMVGAVYWKERDLDRIKTYCEQDVLTVAQLLLRFERMALLQADEVHIA